MRKLLPLIALLTACSNGPLISDKDLLFREDYTLRPQPGISVKGQRRDLDLLLFAFRNAYGGRKYVPQDSFQAALEELTAWQTSTDTPVSSEIFCEELDTVFSKIQDNHLAAKIGSRSCGKWERRRKPSVGSNVGTKQKGPWSIGFKKVGGLNIPVIAIRSFPPSQDPIWNGFLEKAQRASTDAKAIIIDLRGNGGGDDAFGLRLAEVLYGGRPASPLAERIRSNTAATLATLVSSDRWHMFEYRSRKEPVPHWLEEHLTAMTKVYDDARTGSLIPEEKKEDPHGLPFNPQKGFNGPIEVLIDSDCASSCESTLEALAAHPRVTTVGENTGGYIHFGNLGYFVLPASQVLIQMPTDFWGFKDGRYLEKIGYAPKLRVPAGEDALNAAFEDIKKQLFDLRRK